MKNLLVDKTKQKNNKNFWIEVEDEKKHLSMNQERFSKTREQSEGESMVCVWIPSLGELAILIEDMKTSLLRRGIKYFKTAIFNKSQIWQI